MPNWSFLDVILFSIKIDWTGFPGSFRLVVPALLYTPAFFTFALGCVRISAMVSRTMRECSKIFRTAKKIEKVVKESTKVVPAAAKKTLEDIKNWDAGEIQLEGSGGGEDVQVDQMVVESAKQKSLQIYLKPMIV